MSRVKTYEEAVKRFNKVRVLREKGLSFSKIGKKLKMSPSGSRNNYLRKQSPRKSQYMLSIAKRYGAGHISGRDMVRMLVRVRDKFTCADCQVRRTPRMVNRYNSECQGLRGRIKLHDVHHLNGLCGKMTRDYDDANDISGLITLCHRCHFNRPEHGKK